MENWNYESSVVRYSITSNSRIKFSKTRVENYGFIPKPDPLIKPWLIAITIRCLFLIHVLKSACFVFIANKSKVRLSLSHRLRNRVEENDGGTECLKESFPTKENLLVSFVAGFILSKLSHARNRKFAIMENIYFLISWRFY